MTAPIANFSGLSSGVQWNDIVDSVVAADEARLVNPITAQLDRGAAQREAWTRFRSLVDSLNDAARAVRAPGFGGFIATAPVSATTGRTLFTAQASSLATAGRYRVEVQQLAETAKLGGRAYASRTDALGLTGDFAINGQSIAIADTDSLTQIRDRINAANTGATATGVSASIVSDGGTGGRLVLTRTTPGADGITLTDGTGGMARELGFLDSRTRTVSSMTDAIAASLGIAVSPPPASVRVGDQLITFDLATDSLATIVARINAAGGQAAAEVVPFGDETRYQLVTDGNVQAVEGDPDSQAVLDALGFAAGRAGAVRQVVRSGALTDAGDAVATAATPLAGLRLDGTDVALANGDAINVRGVRGDGTTVTIGIAIDPGETLQDLLDKLNDATSGFGAGDRPATASIGPDGRIRLADSGGGASRLSFSLDIVRADGSTGSLGSSSIETAGRQRELQAGRDAIIRVDGTEFVRRTNSITDAIPNVTLSLTEAEVGTAIDLDIARDEQGASDAVKKLVDSYNEIQVFFNEQRAPDAPLYGNSLLRGVITSFTAALRTETATNETYSRATLMGVTLDRNGGLTFNASTFRQALAAAPAEVEALLGFTGIGGAFVRATDQATSFSNGTISTQVRSIDSSAERLRLREADARRRIEERREALVRQFTQMETALSRLSSQGNAIAGLTASLLNNRR
jgi:flagellar hook-associated protein 2